MKTERERTRTQSGTREESARTRSGRAIVGSEPEARTRSPAVNEGNGSARDVREHRRPTRWMRGRRVISARAHSPGGHQMDRGGWNGADDRRTGRPEESGIERNGSVWKAEKAIASRAAQSSDAVTSLVGAEGGRTGGAVGRSEQFGPEQGVFDWPGVASSWAEWPPSVSIGSPQPAVAVPPLDTKTTASRKPATASRIGEGRVARMILETDLITIPMLLATETGVNKKLSHFII
jgi:hypothetical protein